MIEKGEKGLFETPKMAFLYGSALAALVVALVALGLLVDQRWGGWFALGVGVLAGTALKMWANHFETLTEIEEFAALRDIDETDEDEEEDS